MEWTIQDLGAIGEVIGGIGVLITLIYLAVQLKRTTAQLRVDSYQRHLENHGTQLRAVCLDPHVAKTFTTGLIDHNSLSPEDQMMFHGAVGGFLYAYLANRRLFEEGILSQEDFEMWEHDIIRLLSSEGGNQWWEQKKEMYWPSVRERLDRLLVEKGPKLPPVDKFFRLS